MKLNNQELYEFFLSLGIRKLYHANTVTTSISFIEAGGLLSRGAVELLDLKQTAQKSDLIDKKHNVWSDIFLDTTDLHSHFRRQNYYGPILFEITSDFIIDENYEIWITKRNPIEWSGSTPPEEKHFTSVEELKRDWDKYPLQKKMITIKNSVSPLPWKYLIRVIVDDPNVKFNGTVYYSEALTALKELIFKNEILKGKFFTRTCTNCYCKSNYLTEVSTTDLNKLFLPL